jgi:hypothetical protein
MSSGPNPRVHPAACAEQPEPKEETGRKCADEKSIDLRGAFFLLKQLFFAFMAFS